MHFLPTTDQRELAQGVRDLLDARFPLDRLPAGYDAQLWRELSETGVFSLRTELGLGLVDAVLVLEELGRAAVPGPVVPTVLGAGLVDAAVVGCLDATREPLLVAHATAATALLVLSDDSVAVAAVPPEATAVPEPLDPLTPLHQLAAVPVGDVVGDRALAGRLRAEGAVLTAALQVGLAARLTELAVGYAKTREQFGRAIGSFQAVKHICADMLVRTELARVAVHAAAVGLDGLGAGEPPDRAVAGAKLLADEAAVGNGRAAVQVYGGMGFTWEVPVHFFLKRAWVQATEFGTADDHAEALAATL